MITDATLQLFLGLAALPLNAIASILSFQYPQGLREALQYIIGKLYMLNGVVNVPVMISLLSLTLLVEAALFGWWVFSHFVKTARG